LLVEKLIARGRVRAAVLDEIEIEPAIVVEVEQRDAGADFIGHEVVGSRNVNELDPGTGGDIGKPFGSGRQTGSNGMGGTFAAAESEAADS